MFLLLSYALETLHQTSVISLVAFDSLAMSRVTSQLDERQYSHTFTPARLECLLRHADSSWDKILATGLHLALVQVTSLLYFPRADTAFLFTGQLGTRRWRRRRYRGRCRGGLYQGHTLVASVHEGVSVDVHFERTKTSAAEEWA